MEYPQNLIDHKRLADVIKRAVVNGTDSRFHRTMSGHDDDFRIRVHTFHPLEEVQAGVVAQVDIADEDVEALLLHRSPRLFPRHRQTKRIGLNLQNGPHQLANGAVVIHYQDLRFYSHTASL